MKHLLLCLMLFLTINSDVLSQQSAKLELTLSTDYYLVVRDQFSWFLITPTYDAQYLQDATSRIHPSLSLKYFFTDRFSIKLGIRYYDFGHKSDRLQINFTPPAIESLHRYKAHFISIPIGVDFRFINRKIFSYIGSSFLMDIYLGETSNEPEFVTIDALDWRSFNASIGANLGLGYTFYNAFALSIEPYVTVPLHDYMIEDRPSSAQSIHPFRIGIQVGLNYRFQ